LGLWLQVLISNREFSDLEIKNQQKVSWSLWMIWVLGSIFILGFGLFFSIKTIDTTFYFSESLPIVLLVVFQCLVLRFKTAIGGRWIKATLISLIPSLIVTSIIWHIALSNHPGCSPVFYSMNCDLSAKATVNAIGGAVFGISTCLIQALLLSKLAKQGIFNPADWAFASVLVYILIGATWASTGIENPLLIGALSGAMYGSITGVILIWSMKRDREVLYDN
jgi:hypothetical protein